MSEEVLGIDLNPGNYIPNLACTRDLKKKLHNSSHRRQWGGVRQLLPGTSVALLRKLIQQQPQDYHQYAQELQAAGACDRALVACTRARQERLAARYEQLANHLLEKNEELKQVIDAKEAQMSPAEVLQSYDILHKNILQAAELKQKADALLQKAAELSPAERRLLAAEEDRLGAKQLVEAELAWRRR